VNLVKRNAKPPAPLKVPLTPQELASKKEASTESDKKETGPSVSASPPKAVVAPPQVTKKTAAAPAVAPSKTTVPSKVNKGYGPAKEIWCGAPDDELEGGWPPGWTKRTFERASGKSKGSTDSYWYAPEGGRRLRSMVEVRRHLGLKEVPSMRKRPRTQVSFVASAKAASADSGTKQHVVKDVPVKKRPRKKKPVKKATGPRFTQDDIHLVRASMLNGVA
jgi:hypothetical protein